VTTAKGKPRALYTEAEMTAMLKAKHTSVGNGGSGEWAFMAQVRDEAGFDATRTLDALAMGLWKSRGFDLHGFEIKCSRSDYLSEIKNPAKAEVFGSRVDYFWIVVADPKIVKDDLPYGWGLMAATAPKIDEETGRKTLGTIRVVKQAPRQALTEQQRLITRSWLVSILRSAGAVPGERQIDPEEIAVAKAEAWKAGVAMGERETASLRQRVDTLQAQVQAERELRRAFEQHAGISLANGYRDLGLGKAEHVGDMLRAALKGDQAIESALHRMKDLERQIEQLLHSLRITREEHGGAMTPYTGEAHRG
jgi:hypothetical protein